MLLGCQGPDSQGPGFVLIASFLLTDTYRTKFGQWIKKFAKTETFALEFEVAVGEKQQLGAFLQEVTDKLDHMVSFKKTYLKFHLGVESSFKNVDLFGDYLYLPWCMRGLPS